MMGKHFCFHHEMLSMIEYKAAYLQCRYATCSSIEGVVAPRELSSVRMKMRWDR